MRLALAFVALAASAVSAHAAEDRYGPTAVRAGAAPTQPYAGPMLSWSGKVAPAAAAAAPPAGPAGPALLPGGLYRSALPVPAPAAPPMAPLTARTPVAAYAPPVAAPQSLYSRPMAAAPAAAPPPPSPTAIQGGLYASSAPRFYSVHRPYGETPDPIAMPTQDGARAFRPEASLAGAVSLSGVGAGVRDAGAEDDDGGMAGVGAADAQDAAEREAKRDAERAAARRAAAAGGGQ
jgi:hypothetical protein